MYGSTDADISPSGGDTAVSDGVGVCLEALILLTVDEIPMSSEYAMRGGSPSF
jgi:hypothetical protein